MTTVTRIIDLAYREANYKNILGTPTTEEYAEGLTLLQSLVDSLPGLVVGIRMTPWYIPRPQKTADISANYPATNGDVGFDYSRSKLHPPANTRLMFGAITSDTSVYFQYQPQDGAIMEYVDVGHEHTVTLEANGAIFGITGTEDFVEILPQAPAGRNAPRRWIYRGDYGSWQEISSLALASEMPYPSAIDDYFVTALAIRLSPRFGGEPRQSTVMRYAQMETYVRLLYMQTAEQVIGTAGTPTYQTYATRYATSDFDSGGF